MIIGATNHEYYFGFFRNYRNEGTLSIILITTGSQSVQYLIQAPGIGYSDSGTVTPNVRSIITLPDSLKVSSYMDENKGIYLTTSSGQVTVLGQSIRHGSSDTFLILPLTRQYIAEYVYYGVSVARTTAHSEALHSITLVVGTKDSTVLNLTVTQSVTIRVGGTISNLTPGIVYSFVINRLQTLYIASVNDITGTRIVTNQPVSVFSGHECANIPASVTACDYIIEQIPPTMLWGRVYYVAPLATRSRSTIKVLAAYDSTNVDMYCRNAKASYAINQGRFIERIIGQENCAIYASNEVMIAQFGHGSRDDSSTGDPMMMLVPPTAQYYDSLVFSTIYDPSWSHYLNIIVLVQYYQPDMMYLMTDGINKSLSMEQWMPITVNSIIEAYITQVNIFQEGIVKILHTNAKALMTTLVYGFLTYGSYGHPGGFHDIAGTYFIVHS